MSSVEGPGSTQPSLVSEYDSAKDRSQRRQSDKATFHKKQTYQRNYWRDYSIRWSLLGVDIVIAPKWQRHQDDRNPRLLDHEQDRVAPRYGGDAICWRLRPEEKISCSCLCCKPWDHSRAHRERREIRRILKKFPSDGLVGSWLTAGNVGSRQRWTDWDANGWGNLYRHNGDENWMPHGQDEKRAPEPTVDLLLLAKPVKHRKKRASPAEIPSPSKRLELPPAVEGDVPTDRDMLTDGEEVSVMDFEAWEILGLDGRSMSDGEGESESEWERVSQTSSSS